MEIIHLKHFFEVDKKDYLGFYGYDIFESDTEEIHFQNLLKNDILSDKNTINSFGPFKIDILTEKDFEKINFIELNNILEEYYKDETWGCDLELFKSNVIKAFNYLKIEEYEIYYINIEKVRSEIKPEYNFWTYFVGLICIN